MGKATQKATREQQYCAKCEKQTDVIWNDFMVRFCGVCFNPHKVGFESRAYICRMCERGFDEAYPGQNLCAECEIMSEASWGG